MLNSIRADFYRIFHKRSFYIFLGICSLGFLSVVYIASNQNFGSADYMMLIQIMMSIVPLFIGAYVFNTIYTDDLRSKSLQTAIGFGKRRSVIVVVKLIDALLLMAFVSLLMFAHILIAPVFLSFNLNGDMIQFITGLVVTAFIKTIGYFAISSVAVYFYQKTTASTTVFILLATGTIESLLGLILGQSFVVNLIGDIQPYLFSNITETLESWLISGSGSIVSIGLQIGAYIVIATLLASIAFKHKELEF